MPNLDAFHGETIRVLSGEQAGKCFIGRVECQPDDVLATMLGQDSRAKDSLYFTLPGPGLESQTVVQTEDSRKWKATRREFGAYQEEAYDIIEIAPGKDT